MIIRTTRKTTFIVLAVPAVLAPRVPPSHSSLLTVRHTTSHPLITLRNQLICTFADSKQARDLVSILQEAKQQIDPRLAEMVRYGGGGGGGGRYGGRGYGRGGGRGGRSRY